MAEEKTKEITDEQVDEKSEQKEEEIKNIVTIEDSGPCKKKVSVEIPEEKIKKFIDEQYDNLRKDAAVPGFRKGRAPRRLLEKRFGKETTEQIKLQMLADSSEKAIKDNELQTLGDPDIDYENIELPAEGSFKYEFEVEVRPEFELPDLKGIPVTKTKLEVTDELVDNEIEQLQRWSGVWTPREGGTVEPEDQIVADVTIKAEDIEEEQKLNNIDIHVRPNGFVQQIPIENLDKLLVGAKAGQKKKTNVEISKTYVKEEYRGKKVDIEIEIKDIKWLKPAELDENLFARYSVENKDELRERIQQTLESRLDSQMRNETSEQIYKYLLDNTEFELPLDIVAQQANTVLQRQYTNLIMRGLSREQVQQNMEQLQAGSEEQAKEQLKIFFIMDKVAEKLDISVSEEEINSYIAQAAVQRGQRPERMKEEMARDGSLAQFSLEVRQNKCIDKLLETAKITEKKPDKKAKKATKTTKKTTKKSTKKTE